MAARNGKCFHTVERHGKGIAHANHLPTVWGQCPRSNTSWEPLWLTPVGIGHKGDQCIGGTLPSLNPHPCAPRGELDGLYPVDVSPKIGKLHRFQLSPFDRHTVHAQVVAVRSIRSEEHTSELQSRLHLVCRLLLEKKNRQWTHAGRIQ